jgi:hypothetical protein
METLFSWYFVICIFPGGVIGFLISALYDATWDTDHFWGFLYWPILLIVMIVRTVYDWLTYEVPPISDDYWP